MAEETTLEETLEQTVEIANPQHPHCATVLVLDTSGSMSGDKIRQLNDAIRFFQEDVASDDLARKRVELALLAFGDDVRLEQGFGSVEDMTAPTLKANGGTPMGSAILKAVELVTERKASYRQVGTDYFRPWIFLITDGQPTDMSPGDETWRKVVEAVHGGEKRGEFLFFGVGVEPADMSSLAEICPSGRPPLKLRPGHFKEMFAWLSKSQQRVSASRVGEQVPLPDPTGPHGWAEIDTL